MSKAEEFIKAKTRIGSNTTKGWRRNGVSIPSYSLPWLTPDQARKAVGIARGEMIEKACEYVDGLIDILNDHGHGLKKERIIGGLKQAMKDE